MLKSWVVGFQRSRAGSIHSFPLWVASLGVRVDVNLSPEYRACLRSGHPRVSSLSLEFRASGFGLRVWSLEFRVSGFGVNGLWCRSMQAWGCGAGILHGAGAGSAHLPWLEPTAQGSYNWN